MDAGVLQLHVFPHEATALRPKLFDTPEDIVPTITSASAIEQTAPVSVVIPTFFNKSLKNDTLRLQLAGLESSAAVAEVILVVSGDPDQEHEHRVSVPGHKRVVRVPCAPQQRALARNLGAAAANHELLLFLDDDMLLDCWATIDVLVSRLLTAPYDCALFPRRHYARFPLLYDTDGLEQTVAQWRAHDSPLAESVVFDPVRHGCPFKTMAFCFPGCFMLIRKEAFQLIGGFPTDFVGWGFEDSDFAVRATSVLRVLNLFRKSHPLLHVDHPVSPYKSEEYGENLRRFLAAHTMSDVDRLCTHVVSGEDFLDGARTSQRTSSHLEPLQQLVASNSIPALQDAQVRRSVTRRYEQLLEARLSDCFDAVPRHVVLHGSRGAGTASENSDFDVLFLYRGGIVREFFTCATAAGPSVDFEFSDCGKFEGIAQRPVLYPFYGPLELEKLAHGQLLLGDADEWEEWVHRQLNHALRAGLAYWMLYALGMSLRKPDCGPAQAPLLAALRHLLIRSRAEIDTGDLPLLENFRPQSVGPRLRSMLDTDHSGWRDDLSHHRRVFAFQVPEVWTALHWLIHSE